ncbi:alcohol dehydrogenase catalytic domain-containing protein [Pseudonocardia sp. C8]|uniref:alcohol dehydrogenase catalytic domain-containing protein n=1 Tax=Pseudonocardia sp. C8 TaxID=2762759 RepID=UPI001642ACD1|nr:alcohol dehydrogenase catalytic domain-containing protein [Pseudonocardia sp. C8]MBC3189953.1 alcohol dehydrogenase catalytic domain-containing protein [Pseudonocardia sp. C8]
MKAWQLVGKRRPLVLDRELPDPAPTWGEVVIDVRAAGLCHSDIGFIEHDGFRPPHLPFILGHEIAGVISQIGPGVAGWCPGDRVSVSGPGDDLPGLDRDGGYAEQVVVRADHVMGLPGSLPFELAAVAMDAGATSHAAVMTGAQAAAGKKIGIIGFGGLGQFGVRLARHAGAEVYVSEIRQDVWPSALAAGAVAVAPRITDFADRDLDAIVDFAGFGTTTTDAMKAVRRHGRVVQVGLGVTEATLSMLDLTLGRITLVGIMGGEREDSRRVCDLLATRDIHVDVQRVRFDEIPRALDRLRRGDVVGRVVAMMDG